MDSKERRQVENQLIAMGLKDLRSPELVQQLANLINCWPGDKHDFLMGLINECEREDRVSMYEAIRPHLNFKVLPLGTYEDRIALAAAAMVSQGRMRVEGKAPEPIEIGNSRFYEVPRQDAEAAIATLKCHECKKEERFLGDTAVGAMTNARAAGWRRDPARNKEICIECQQLLETGVRSREVIH